MLACRIILKYHYHYGYGTTSYSDLEGHSSEGVQQCQHRRGRRKTHELLVEERHPAQSQAHSIIRNQSLDLTVSPMIPSTMTHLSAADGSSSMCSSHSSRIFLVPATHSPTSPPDIAP